MDPKKEELEPEVIDFLQYLKFEKRYSQHTYKAYKKDIEQFSEFLKKEGEKTLLNCSVEIRSWIVSLIHQQKKTTTINQKIATLSAFYNFLLKKKRIDKNPMLRIKKIKVGEILPKAIGKPEIEKLFSNPIFFANEKHPIKDKLILELFYGTGMRLSELISLRISDISLSQRKLKVLGKGNRERYIPITQHLAILIEAFIKEEKKSDKDYLITTKDNKKSYPMMLQRIVKKYLNYINCDQKSPHTLRHSLATHLLDNGADIEIIGKILGHRQLSTTTIYTKVSIEKAKKVYKKSHPRAIEKKENPKE